MKPLVIVAILSLLVLVQGCTSNDKDGAGRESSVTTPAAATVAPASGSAAPISRQSEPAANGGASLAASAPYSQGVAAQQNINPAPFMTAGGGQGQSAGSSDTAAINGGGLTSRADGTMSGPNDLPAATTGWGTSGPQPNSPASTAKPATRAKAPPK